MDKNKSVLERIIPGEIKNDDFYVAILRISYQANIKTVLEIGSSAGGGSTEAFVKGLSHNPNHPVLFCVEVSTSRFKQLEDRYRDLGFVKCSNVSSVPVASFPTPQKVTQFYKTTKTSLNRNSLDEVLGWLDQDLKYIEAAGVPQDGIRRIKNANGIDAFDMVLIDGSEFSGVSELEATYGAKLILLDDVNSFKNWTNNARLKADPNYELILENLTLRNGYSVFKRVDFPFVMDLSQPLPVQLPNKFSAALDRAKRKIGRLVGS
jgi:hypothetical protein